MQIWKTTLTACGLQAKKLRENRLDLNYAPTAYRQETASVVISIGGS